MRISDWSSDVCSSDLHLGRGLHVVAVAGEREPLARSVSGRDVHRGPGVDAQQVLLRLRVLLADVVRVVGRDRRDAEVLAELEPAVADAVLDRHALVPTLADILPLPDDVPAPAA